MDKLLEALPELVAQLPPSLVNVLAVIALAVVIGYPIFLDLRYRNANKEKEKTLSCQISKLQAERDELSRRAFEMESAYEARIAIAMSALSLAASFGHHSGQVALWINTLDGRRIYHNKGFEILTGVPLAKVLGRSQVEMYEGLGPCAEEHAQNWATATGQVAKGHEIERIECWVNVDSPDQCFSVLALHWPTWVGSQVTAHQGMAIVLSTVEDTQVAHEALSKERQKLQGHGIMPTYEGGKRAGD